MLRYLLPPGPRRAHAYAYGVLTMAFVLCAPVVTQVGDLPRDPVGGIWEDWCGWDLDGWQAYQENSMANPPPDDVAFFDDTPSDGLYTSRPYCGSDVNPGVYRVDPLDPPAHGPAVDVALTGKAGIGQVDMTGRQFWFRLDPLRLDPRPSPTSSDSFERVIVGLVPQSVLGPSDLFFFSIFRGWSAGEYVHNYFFETHDDSGGLVSLTPADEPDFQWVRFTHDAETGDLGFWTSGDCETWTLRHSFPIREGGTVSSLAVNIEYQIRDFDTPSGEHVDFTGGSIGALYLQPFPAPDPTPEATP